MSQFRFEALPLSLADIEQTAWAVRQLLGLTSPYLPVTDLIEFGLSSLASGFHYDIATAYEMGLRHGAVDRDRRVLYLREDVYQGVLEKKGRDRFTACHELGHVLLHGGTLNRIMPDQRTVIYRDPEWQANAFAGAILMPQRHVVGLRSVRDLREIFGVTLEAAEVRMKVLGIFPAIGGRLTI